MNRKITDAVIRAALDAPPESLTMALDALQGNASRPAVEPRRGLLDIDATRAWLGGISRTTLWRHRRHGLKTIILGGRVLFREQDLIEFVESKIGVSAESDHEC